MTKDPKNEDNDLINVDDFKSARLEIRLVNLTTNTEIKAGKKRVDPTTERYRVDEGVQFLEFLDNGLVVEVPPHSGAKGHKLLAKIEVLGIKNEISIEARTQITEVESLNNGKSFRVSLEVEEQDLADWKSVQNYYTGRQEEIMNFFEAVRGY